MRILVSGSSGFVGSALVSFLTGNHHQVIRLVRTRDDLDTVYWDPEKNYIEKNSLQDIDAVIHLAAENIHGRWTNKKKRKILSSRIQGTTLLAKTLSELEYPPEVFVCASGVTYYGNNTSEPVDESGPVGPDFLAHVCQEWENACDIAKNVGIRVVNLRMGAVLDASGGMLEKFVPLVKAGLGGTWGTGKQNISWIALDDLLEIMLYVILDKSVKGPVNVVSPKLVTNLEFMKILGRLLSRPILIPIPEGLARLLFGQWADSTLIADYRVIPKVLLEKHYRFHFADIEDALKHALHSKKG